MPQYLTEDQREIWQFLPNRPAEWNVKKLLTLMACFRQAKMDRETLELFTAYLLPLDLRAFQVAMATISASKRQDGETSFPDLGTILSAMDEARERSPLYSQGAKEINDKPVFVDPSQKRLSA